MEISIPSIRVHPNQKHLTTTTGHRRLPPHIIFWTTQSMSFSIKGTQLRLLPYRRWKHWFPCRLYSFLNCMPQQQFPPRTTIITFTNICIHRPQRHCLPPRPPLTNQRLGWVRAIIKLCIQHLILCRDTGRIPLPVRSIQQIISTNLHRLSGTHNRSFLWSSNLLTVHRRTSNRPRVSIIAKSNLPKTNPSIPWSNPIG